MRPSGDCTKAIQLLFTLVETSGLTVVLEQWGIVVAASHVAALLVQLGLPVVVLILRKGVCLMSMPLVDHILMAVVVGVLGVVGTILLAAVLGAREALMPVVVMVHSAPVCASAIAALAVHLA